MREEPCEMNKRLKRRLREEGVNPWGRKKKKKKRKIR